MKLPKIERSRVDERWCVYTDTFESLCPVWLMPVVWIRAVFS